MNIISLRENVKVIYNKHKSIIVNFDNVSYNVGKEISRIPNSYIIDMTYDPNLSRYTFVASKEFVEDILEHFSHILPYVDNTK